MSIYTSPMVSGVTVLDLRVADGDNSRTASALTSVQGYGGPIM